MSKSDTLSIPPFARNGVPLWALVELQEDLQDAAVDLGAAYGAGIPAASAEARYDLAASKLRRALQLAGA